MYILNNFQVFLHTCLLTRSWAPQGKDCSKSYLHPHQLLQNHAVKWALQIWSKAECISEWINERFFIPTVHVAQWFRGKQTVTGRLEKQTLSLWTCDSQSLSRRPLRSQDINAEASWMYHRFGNKSVHNAPSVKVGKFSKNKESLIYRTSWKRLLSSKFQHVFLSLWTTGSEGDTEVLEPRETHRKAKDEPPCQAKETVWDQRVEADFIARRENRNQNMRKYRPSRS